MPSYISYKNNLKAILDADDTEIESWITVRGNHIPIKKGQSKEEAVKSFIEHQAGKNDLPQGTKWSPTNKKGEGTGNKSAPKKEKYNIQHGAKISDIESMINAHADKKAYKSWKEEEEHVAEKLKQEGIYAYGSQIKEAMKNVYGDAYTQERKEESKYDPEFEVVRKNALANSSVYGGKYTQKSKAEAYKEYKNDISSKENLKKANEFVNGTTQKQEAGYGALEIAYNMEFGNNAAKNKSALLKEIKESGEKNAKYMIAIVENMEEKHFESQEAFRKGIKNAKKTDNNAKNKLYGINNGKQVFSIKGGRVVVDPELKTANWYNSKGALTLKQKDLDTDAFIKHGVNELGWQKMTEKEESVLKEFQKIANKPEYKDKEVEAGFETLPKDYTIAHKDKNGKTTVIAEVSHHDINKKK